MIFLLAILAHGRATGVMPNEFPLTRPQKISGYFPGLGRFYTSFTAITTTCAAILGQSFQL
jgi:hypothetical protein